MTCCEHRGLFIFWPFPIHMRFFQIECKNASNKGIFIKTTRRTPPPPQHALLMQNIASLTRSIYSHSYLVLWYNALHFRLRFPAGLAHYRCNCVCRNTLAGPPVSHSVGYRLGRRRHARGDAFRKKEHQSHSLPPRRMEERAKQGGGGRCQSMEKELRSSANAIG